MELNEEYLPAIKFFSSVILAEAGI